MTNYQRTELLLKSISKRLSSRNDCKRVEFIVDIGIHDSASILFDPDTYVFKDSHHRKDIDSYRIVDFILMKNMPEAICGRNNQGYLSVDTTMFSRGIFKYELAYNGKKRRWVKF